VGPRAGLDRCGKSHPYKDSIPGPSSLQPVAIPNMPPSPLSVLWDIVNLYERWFRSRECVVTRLGPGNPGFDSQQEQVIYFMVWAGTTLFLH
jgi:hypothetical protein